LVGESLHHVVGYVSAPRGRIGGGFGGMAGSVGSALFAFYAGHILQLNATVTPASSASRQRLLLALIVLCLLAPGLRKVELDA